MKDTTIKIRVSKSIKDFLLDKAHKREVTLTDFLLKRALINKDLTLEEKSNLKDLLYQTQKIGINLNQLTKKLNSLNSNLSINSFEMSDIIKQLQEIKLCNINILSFIKKLL